MCGVNYTVAEVKSC